MPAAAEKDRNGVESPGGAPVRPRRGGGFRSQPLALKILLLASLAAMVTGVVRCSIELTPPLAPVRTIAVAPVVMDVPSGLFAAPADSVARVAGRQFARALGKETGLAVAVAGRGPTEADAVAQLTITSARGQVSLAGEVTSATTRRVLARFDLGGPPDMLYATLALAARRAAEQLGSGGRR
jgi:hypothetical protein